MREHAILSASGSHRWLACPPSARLEETFPEKTSVYADEGTLAHHMGEIELDYLTGGIDYEEYSLQMQAAKEDELYSNDMEEYVSLYVEEVMARFKRAQEKDKNAKLFLERRLDFSRWVPEGFGRGDAMILADGTLEIIDLKYGQNVRVNVHDNPQLRLYALGAYADAFSLLYQPKEVTMTIVQPRNGGVSSETLSVEELLGWGDNIKEVAELAIKGEGEFKAGEHCRFCRASVRCRALSEYNLELAKLDFQDPNTLSDEEVAEVLGRLDELTRWGNKVKEYALEEAKTGRKWLGFKLVEGRSIRKITDETAAATILTENGFTDIYKPKELLSITGLEKLCGKKRMSELLASVITRPQGKPTLVPDSDPREEFNSIEGDFEVIA